MTNLEIPPCGPERDRLVAEAVGWEFFTLGGKSWCSIGVTGRAMLPSQSDSDALAALEAWRLGGPDRTYTIDAPDPDDPMFWVGMATPQEAVAFASRPTFADAATAALARWYLDTQEVSNGL